MRINATRMTTPIEEKVDQKLKVRTGMVAVSDGKSKPVPVRLHLSMEVLRLQKEEIVPPEPKPINAKVVNPFILFIIVIFVLWVVGEDGTDKKAKGRRIGTKHKGRS